ncbi:hypothetical protein Cyrtocomes_00799 [Candidatus Cyrtobacter comes]|uniref:Uncharacterized protein n=1 Tax=Candidatus Cyrtobacter comes TaxID=675776 RepID=A0ABU5L8H3_9RICK|nr:hypothetical protein [Candidatus Cyrtobacter comes]MDZ5762417.1 hypothetical protein [Candidatus Cyrtobacter comes]
MLQHYIENGSSGFVNELQIKCHNIIIIATDGNYSYNKIIPNGIKHIVDKAETCLVEAKDSSLMGPINQRKRYSKCHAQDDYVEV